ncbi:MAG TPA: tripartite tricarboxylate transporter substrate binding protein [Xanthobacteraceae bacterium]|nr:tripartite tricarboxylate transporter substrate binding protein [Xanthobacteraceae bacterium]
MSTLRGRGLVVLAAIALTANLMRSSDAQDYPARLVTLVVPSPAGSTTDALARLLAEQLNQKWGRSVIVENNSRGLNAGAEQVARANPDGNTLLVSPPLPLTVADLLYREIGYRPWQFAPVSLLAKIANALVVRKDFPARTVQELVTYGKANQGKLTYGSQGAGSTAHLSGAQLEMRAGIKMVHVPYRGSAPALNDIIAGHIDMFFDTLTTSVPLHQADKVRIMAVAGTERAAALPDVPTIAESSLPGFRSTTWFAMVAPPNTPAALTSRINRDVVEVLQRPLVQSKLRDLRLDAMIGSPADASKFFAEETQLWGGVIKEAKVTVQ